MDGLATGHTMMAALESARRRGASEIVVAVPVAPPDALAKFSNVADAVISIETPEDFYAVGAHYVDFRQVTEDEVRQILTAVKLHRPNSI